MTTAALLTNLEIISSVADYGNIRIVPVDSSWPSEPDTLPKEMTLESHVLMQDTRWSWVRPWLRVITGDTDHAVVNFLLIITRELTRTDLNANNVNSARIAEILHDAAAGLRRLQDTTYKDNKFVKLALIACRCEWESFIYEKKTQVSELQNVPVPLLSQSQTQ